MQLANFCNDEIDTNKQDRSLRVFASPHMHYNKDATKPQQQLDEFSSPVAAIQPGSVPRCDIYDVELFAAVSARPVLEPAIMETAFDPADDSGAVCRALQTSCCVTSTPTPRRMKCMHVHVDDCHHVAVNRAV